MSESRTYLLDPLYETETLKLPPAAADYMVMGSGALLSFTGMLAASGSIAGMLASLAPGAIAGASSLIKLGDATAVERIGRRLGHKSRVRALNPRGEEKTAKTVGPSPHHVAFTGVQELRFHQRDRAAFPQAHGRTLTAFEWLTDGAALKDPTLMYRAHDELAAFLEWVAATGPGACVRIVHEVTPYGVDEDDARTTGEGELGESYRQLVDMVGDACDFHATVIVLSVPAHGDELQEEHAWLEAAHEQAAACGMETGPLWGMWAWSQALPPELTDGPFEVHEDHFRAAGLLHATADVSDFRRGQRSASFWRPMVTTLPRVRRTTVIEYLPQDRRRAEKRLETGEMLRTATARSADDARREKTSTRTGRKAADLHEEDLENGATYVQVAARITVHAATEKELKTFRSQLEQTAVSAGAHLTWMDREHETGWRSSLPLPGGEFTC
ncbi:hypothetical protein ACIRLA_08000 [Streptomyces sp. NPDC102364]|uniref:hypothetical protein n=1 Tax=Streptomyces sp. NPDC102364 TaxID=3366161 RepID=UPI0038202541